MTDVCIQWPLDVCVINLMHRTIIVSHSLTTPHKEEGSSTITHNNCNLEQQAIVTLNCNYCGRVVYV